MCPCLDTPLESGIPYPTHDSIIPTFGGADLHTDPSLDSSPKEEFLPLESGAAPCPMHDSLIPTFGGVDLHTDPSPGFRRLMEEFLHPKTPPSSGREASVRPGLPRKIHSPEHILLECPLTKPYRYLIHDSILGTVNVCNLFYTIKGAKSLATFLLHSNSLLHPLPP